MRSANKAIACLLGAMIGCLTAPALAHEPILKCVLLDAENVRCRGGFAEGEDAQGTHIEVIDHEEKTLLRRKLGKDSLVTFPRPKGGYYVLLDVGPGEQAIVEHDEIRPPRASDKARWVRR